MPAKITVTTVLNAAWALMRRYPLRLMLCTLGLAVLHSTLRISIRDESTGFVILILNIPVGYFLLKSLFRDEAMIEDEGNFFSYLGVSILSALGITVGFLLLIVPGPYLMGRWSVAPAMVLAKGASTSEALQLSADATRHWVWTLALLYIAWFAICVGLQIAPHILVGGPAAAVAYIFGDGTAQAAPVLVIVDSLISNLTNMAATYLSVAIFGQVVQTGRSFDQVFA